MADLLPEVSASRLVEILRSMDELVDRVNIAIDPDIMRDSGMSTKEQLVTLTGIATELQNLQLESHNQWDKFRLILQTIESRGRKIDPNYGLPTPVRTTQDSRKEGSKDVTMSFPQTIKSRAREFNPTSQLSALKARATQASGSAASGAPVEGFSDLKREPSSGPQRGPTSISVLRDQTNVSTIVSSAPSDVFAETFDVVFISLSASELTKGKISDFALEILQKEQQKLGLIFQVTLTEETMDSSVLPSFTRM
ncbi:hypothetical protein FB45DRAFT_314672 [Roridomyces roridus]|uniref:Uncharacterized protein n=1 Tax=Roridomyces roridus TaxID=1738132 RepID=A0AAD7FA59_9AGAR|nr:hypothetical protein FB45DRAFT_314672 [Roridomyces roridus]